MNNFFSKTIRQDGEVIAEALKRARKEKKISIKTVSEELGIREKYLRAMEDDNFDLLPPGIYQVNFLRKYASFLALSSDDINDAVKQNKKQENYSQKEDLFVERTPYVRFFVTLPRLLRNIFLSGVAVVCFTYLAFGLHAVVAPPDLQIDSPSADMVVKDSEIVVKGCTDPKASIKINNEIVLADETGEFAKTINLKKGINTIVIVAQKKYSHRNKKIKKVLYNESSG